MTLILEKYKEMILNHSLAPEEQKEFLICTDGDGKNIMHYLASFPGSGGDSKLLRQISELAQAVEVVG